LLAQVGRGARIFLENVSVAVACSCAKQVCKYLKMLVLDDAELKTNGLVRLMVCGELNFNSSQLVECRAGNIEKATLDARG
jgi:hypothetical protein